MATYIQLKGFPLGSGEKCQNAILPTVSAVELQEAGTRYASQRRAGP